jgi:hypothetical protein
LHTAVPLGALLLEATRRLPPEFTSARLSDDDERLSPSAGASSVDLQLLPVEGFVLSRVDAPATVGELVAVSGLPEEQTRQAAYALALAGLLAPAVARRFHVFWMKVAAVLGYVNSRVLLTLMYYGVFAPYGLVSRLAGRDPLRRRGAKRESYWTERKTTRQAKEQFERLF